MNTNLKIVLSIVLVAVALYGAFIFGRSTPSSISDINTEIATSTVATSTNVVSTKPTTKPVVVTAKPTTANTLIKIDYRGGICPNGKTCMTTKVITKDAVYYKDGIKVSNINKNDVAKLTLEMERTDWIKLRSNPKTTGCDLVRIQEIVYSFYTKNGLQVVSNCQHDFDITLPLFQTIATLLPQ